MKTKQLSISLTAVVMALMTLTSCDLGIGPIDGFDNYVIFPDGNPRWPNNYGDGSMYDTLLFPALRAVAASGSQVVALGDGALFSADGITWRYVGLGLNPQITHVVWAGDRFVAVSMRGLVMDSPDGHNWAVDRIGQPIEYGTYDTFYQIAADDTLLVAAVDTVASYMYSGSCLKYSTDRVNWTTSKTRVSSLRKFVLWDGNRFLAQGSIDTTASHDSNTIISSTDGSHWGAAGQTPSGHLIYQMIWTGRTYLAVAGDLNGNSVYMTSTNLSDWPEVPTSFSASAGAIWNLAASPSCMVAVNYAGIYASTDGANWKTVSDSLHLGEQGEIMHDVTWTGSLFVAVSGKGIYTSPDGFVWTKRALPQKGA